MNKALLVGNLLQQARKKSKITVEQACKHVNRSKSYYYNLEKGLVPLNTLVIKRLMELYGLI